MIRVVEVFKSEYGLHRMFNPNPVVGRLAFYHCFGLLLNWRAMWVGFHYGVKDKRLCVNVLPCITLWWARPGGRLP